VTCDCMVSSVSWRQATATSAPSASLAKWMKRATTVSRCSVRKWEPSVTTSRLTATTIRSTEHMEVACNSLLRRSLQWLKTSEKGYHCLMSECDVKRAICYSWHFCVFVQDTGMVTVPWKTTGNRRNYVICSGMPFWWLLSHWWMLF